MYEHERPLTEDRQEKDRRKGLAPYCEGLETLRRLLVKQVHECIKVGTPFGIHSEIVKLLNRNEEWKGTNGGRACELVTNVMNEPKHPPLFIMWIQDLF